SVASLTNLGDIPTNFFNRVLMMEVLEHLPTEDCHTVLTEIHRVLAPDGRLLITVPSDLVPVEEKHHAHFSVGSLTKAVRDLFIIEKTTGYHRKVLWYSVVARCLDNKLWTSPVLLSLVYRRFIQLCPVDKGVQLLAICTKQDHKIGRNSDEVQIPRPGP